MIEDNFDDPFERRLYLGTFGSLNRVTYTHNLAVRKLMKWYEDVLRNRELIASVIAVIKEKAIEEHDNYKDNPKYKFTLADEFTKISYPPALSEIISGAVNRVLKELNKYAEEKNICKLLRFDPYYVNYIDAGKDAKLLYGASPLNERQK